MEREDRLKVTHVTLSLTSGPVTVPLISGVPASAFADLRADDQTDEVTMWEPWETAKPEEYISLTITDDSGEQWTSDDMVEFLTILERVRPAALQAIRLELATWGFDELN